MALLCAILAGGLWPAVPLTGYWVFTRPRRASGTGLFPPITSVALMTTAGIVVWSMFLLGSAAAGAYRAEYLGLAGWAVTLATLAWGTWRRRWFAGVSVRLSLWDGVLAAGLVLAAALYLGFPTESIFCESDEGAYANHAVSIAHRGRLDVPYPWPEDTATIFEEAAGQSSSVLFPAFFQTKPTLTVQFGHLFPVWLAHAYSTFGPDGLFRLNAVLALLSLGVFYGVCRAVLSKPFAVAATLFLALNPSQVWLARITLSEVLAQLFIWSGLLLLLHALKEEDRGLARWSGVFVGFSALTRIDGLFLVPALLFSHLVVRIVEEPAKKGSLSVWLGLYQTALPVFALAIGYYATFSAPYFFGHLSYVEKIGLAAAVCLGALPAAYTRFVGLLRPLVTNRAVPLLLGLVLLALTANAGWIKPRHAPYAYGADAVGNLAAYLSPVVVFAAVFGWSLALDALVRKQQHCHVALVVAGLGYSALYLGYHVSAQYHFWVVRRWVPVVIPAFVFFAALGAWWLSGRLPRRWSYAVSALVLVGLGVFTIRADALIVTFAEYKGYFAQVKKLAEKLPEGEVLLLLASEDSGTWATPVYVAFDRKVVPLHSGSDGSRAVLERWISTRAAQGRPVYVLSEGDLRFSAAHRQLERVTLTWARSEATMRPLPERIHHYERVICLYETTGPPVYLDMALGSRNVWGVEEWGVLHQECSADGRPFRCTDGAAGLVVPVDPRQPPRALKVDLVRLPHDGTMFRLLLDGRELFHARVSGRRWSKTFDLTGYTFGGQVRIELLSGAGIPRRVGDGWSDDPVTGVCVQGITLLPTFDPTQDEETQYQHLVQRVREVAHASLPPAVTVIVASHGDDELLDLGSRKGWHFPQTPDGVHTRARPANSAAAVDHLEALRAKGGQYLLFPRTAFWWLEADVYQGFKEHLEERYPRIHSDGSCVIYHLSRRADQRPE